jgi:hypothetical protein
MKRKLICTKVNNNYTDPQWARFCIAALPHFHPPLPNPFVPDTPSIPIHNSHPDNQNDTLLSESIAFSSLTCIVTVAGAVLQWSLEVE